MKGTVMDERKDNPFQEEPVNEAIPMDPANNEGKASEADVADTTQPVAAGADAAQPANPYGAPLQSGVPVNAGAQPVNPYATPVAQPATEAAQPAAQPAAEGGAQPSADAGAAPAADPTQPVGQPAAGADPTQPVNPYAAPAQPQQPTMPMGGPAPQQPANPYGAPVPPPMGGQPGAPAGGYGAPAPQGNGKAIAALICGIAAIIFAFVFSIIGLILGIVAIVLAGSFIKTRGPIGIAKAGRITGIIGVIVSVVMMVIALVLGVAVVGAIIGGAGDEPLTPPTSSSSAIVDSSSSAVVAGSDEEQAAIDMVSARLDGFKNKSDEAVNELATLVDAGFTEQTGYSMQDCGVDPKDYVRAVLDGFDYEQSLVSADSEISDEGFVSYDVTMRTALDVIGTMNDKINEYTSSDEYATTTTEQDMAKMGEIIMEAASETELSDYNYLSVDINYKNGQWVIDEDSWNDEIDWLFGLSD